MTRPPARWRHEDIPEGPIRVRSREGDTDGRFAATLTHDKLPGWEVVVTVDPAGQLEGLNFRPETFPFEIEGRRSPATTGAPRDHLTARLLRLVPVGELHQRALTERRRLATDYSELVAPTMAPEDFEAAFRRFVEAARGHPGRGGHGDRWYAAWAAKYVSTNSRTPIKDLAAETGEDVGYVRNVIDEVRKRELLTRAGAGRAGGELTQKALDLLREDDDGEC